MDLLTLTTTTDYSKILLINSLIDISIIILTLIWFYFYSKKNVQSIKIMVIIFIIFYIWYDLFHLIKYYNPQNLELTKIDLFFRDLWDIWSFITNIHYSIFWNFPSYITMMIYYHIEWFIKLLFMFIPIRIILYKKWITYNALFIIKILLTYYIISWLWAFWNNFIFYNKETIWVINYYLIFIVFILWLIIDYFTLKLVFIKLDTLKDINNWKISKLKYSLLIILIIIFYIISILLVFPESILILFIPTLLIMLYNIKWNLAERIKLKTDIHTYNINIKKIILYTIFIHILLWFILYELYLYDIDFWFISYNIISITLVIVAFNRRKKMFYWSQLTLLWTIWAYIFPIYYLSYLYSLEKK